MAGFDRTRWESTVFGLRKRVLVAVGHTILTSIWHMLTNDAEYTDLGADYFLQRTGRTRQTRRLVSQLNMLGHQMSLQSAEPA
ncbi:hypothetical protein [Streptomyces sp. NBC_01589]|uniref:hypothetical protein n=1 Tax=unclassified Streptomyces TaxID=2593676 RepID=UPI00386B935E